MYICIYLSIYLSICIYLYIFLHVWYCMASTAHLLSPPAAFTRCRVTRQLSTSGQCAAWATIYIRDTAWHRLLTHPPLRSTGVGIKPELYIYGILCVIECSPPFPSVFIRCGVTRPSPTSRRCATWGALRTVCTGGERTAHADKTEAAASLCVFSYEMTAATPLNLGFTRVRPPHNWQDDLCGSLFQRRVDGLKPVSTCLWIGPRVQALLRGASLGGPILGRTGWGGPSMVLPPPPFFVVVSPCPVWAAAGRLLWWWGGGRCFVGVNVASVCCGISLSYWGCAAVYVQFLRAKSESGEHAAHADKLRAAAPLICVFDHSVEACSPVFVGAWLCCECPRELPLGSKSHSRISSLCVCARVLFVYESSVNVAPAQSWQLWVVCGCVRTFYWLTPHSTDHRR